MKDWTGNTRRTLSIIGARNFATHERQKDDYYATEPKATEWLCKLVKFDGKILEPSCGEGHISKVLKEHGYEVISRDLIDRGYGDVADFLSPENEKFDGNIVTNPPYKYAQEFIEKSLQIIPEGKKVAMLLKLTFLEGKRRRQLYANCPPHYVYVSSSRIKCAMNGDFGAMNGSAICYAWFVWEKGYKGDTIVRWFN